MGILSGKEKNKINKICKRDGRIVEFNQEKITNAIFKALEATEAAEQKLAEKLSDRVTEKLNKKFHERTIPAVEEIQDLVEEVLVEENLTKTVRAYILYREQHKQIRDYQTFVNSDKVMGDYLTQADWRVKENANMTFSLQGLNNHVASEVSKHYWLNKIYSPEVRGAHSDGDFHIHDLYELAAYCAGWDLKDLLFRGFGGVSGKVQCKAPKHLRSALGQIVNFFYTLQGETAGAVAFSNFDTYLAPFIRYDNLDHKQVKQAMQEFLFNMNVPTRVGFQCVSEDTEILTKNGWAKHNQVKQGDIIATFNLEQEAIEYLPIKRIFAKEYSGKMYNLKNRISDQLISPEHRVVRRRFGGGGYVLEKIEKVLELKSPFMAPIGSNGNISGKDATDEDIVKLIAWVAAEGSLDKGERESGRISIYQSKIRSAENYNEIIDICKELGLNYSERTQSGLGEECNVIRFDADSTRKILSYFKSNKDRGIKFIPEVILDAGVETARLFLETYIKGDGHDGCKITTTSVEIRDGLMQVIVNAGYGATVLTRKPDNGLSKKDRYIIRIIKHQDTYIDEVREISYKGIIWCPNTNNETVIARRNGKIFITGNTPFTNITLDLKVPKIIADDAVIIGGKLQEAIYGDFQEEMDLFNKVFAEVMMEGDASGRVFTFPIPTYNITKQFDWESEVTSKIFEMTAKYGTPYFSNFVNSDMNPDDARSMCPLAGEEKVLVKSSRGRVAEYSTIRNIFEGNSKQEEYEIYSDGKFIKGKFNKFSDQKMIKAILDNGHEIKMSEEHLNFALFKGRSEVLKGKELKEGMYLPYSLKQYKGEGGNKDLGYFVGAYAGDGSFDGEGTVVFSLENIYKGEVIKKIERISRDYFGAHSVIKEFSGSKLVSLKIHSKAAVGLCQDFVAGKERDKYYQARLFTTSVEFRKNVLAGHYATDGGNRNRIYTSSLKMVETLNMLAATLGTTTSIYKDERAGRFGKEPNYAVLIYQLNRKNYGNFWLKQGNKLWVRIKKIESIVNSTAYCFEVKDGAPVFTVGTTGILTHNCRLRLDNRELRKRGGGLFGANPLTGSIGVVTINLARIGYLAKTKEEYFERLEKLMRLGRQSLEVKRKVLDKFTDEGLYPYCRVYLDGVKKRFGTYWKNHFNTIGINGMNESALNFMGKNLTDKEAQSFAAEVLDFMREKLMDYQIETNDLYNLESTPAEGTSYRFARIDKRKHPEIIVANEEAVRLRSADPFYTNSTHLPVDATDDIFEALDLQDNLQIKYTGGTVFHGYIGEKLPDPVSTANLVKKIAENYHLPYYTITPTFSICTEHGYLVGEHFHCPNCGAEAEVYSRVSGYLRPVQQWNKGKQSEFESRKEYRIKTNLRESVHE